MIYSVFARLEIWRGLFAAPCSSIPGSAKLGDLVPGLSQFGRFGIPEGRLGAGSRGLVPFRGEISSLVPAVGRISRFGTRKSRPGKSRPGVSPDAGNQIAEVGRNRGTKPRDSPKFWARTGSGVPNPPFLADRRANEDRRGVGCYCRAREAMAVPIMEKAAPMRTTQPKTSFPGSDASAMTK